MSTTVQLVTADELLSMPKDGFRYELVRGELLKKPFCGAEHGAIVARITVRLAACVKANNLGVCFAAGAGFKLASDPDTVRAADLSFLSRVSVDERGIPVGFWMGAPDLTVEVIDYDDTFEEVEERLEEWLAAGTKAVWVVNPKRRSVTVYRSMSDVTRLAEGDQLEGGDVVPGFRCKVAEIFV